MSKFALVWGALFMLAYALGSVGAHSLAMILFPVPVGVYWVRGKQGESLGLMVCACAAAFATTASLVGAVEYGVAACVGILVGVVMLRRWSLGWGIALVTAGVYSLLAFQTLANWQETHDTTSAQFQVQREQIEAREETASKDAQLAFLTFWEEEWQHLVFGLLFATVLLMVVVSLTLLAWRFRARGAAYGPIGTFRTMRTPEWVVWVAIVIALMYLWEQRWPNEPLRSVTWNSAIGLALIYFLNGFSVLIYGITVVSVQMYLVFLGIVLLIMLGLHPVLTAVGLFDTWFDFRRLADRIAETQRVNQESNNE